MLEKQNEFLSRMSTYFRAGLGDVRKKVTGLYRIEELEEYDSPTEHILAALMPVMVQVNDLCDYSEAVTSMP